MRINLRWALALLMLILPLTVKAFVPPLPVVTTNAATGLLVTNYVMPAFPARGPAHLMPLTAGDYLVGFTDPLVWLWVAILVAVGCWAIKALPKYALIAWARLRRHLHLGHHHHGHVHPLRA